MRDCYISDYETTNSSDASSNVSGGGGGGGTVGSGGGVDGNGGGGSLSGGRTKNRLAKYLKRAKGGSSSPKGVGRSKGEGVGKRRSEGEAVVKSSGSKNEGVAKVNVGSVYLFQHDNQLNMIRCTQSSRDRGGGWK